MTVSVFISYFRIVTRHMSAEDWMEESSALDNMIRSLGFGVESDVVYINGYSGPGSAHPKSEMWKIKKSLKNVKEDLETVPYTVVATHHVGQNSVSLDNKIRKKVIQNFNKTSFVFQFEERNYDGGMKWVCTESKDDSGMFQKLYQYISGSNSENENIDMTTPVSTKWHKGELHEECFYLNNEHQANPPKPTSPDVYIVTRPAMTIYTRYLFLFYSANLQILPPYNIVYPILTLIRIINFILAIRIIFVITVAIIHSTNTFPSFIQKFYGIFQESSDNFPKVTEIFTFSFYMLFFPTSI